MTSRPRVLYDVSLLGEAHFFPERRTGIHRLVESLAVKLAGRRDLWLSFSAIRSRSILADAERYLAESELLRDVPLVSSRRVAAIIEPLARALTMLKTATGHGIPGRALDKVSRALFQGFPGIEPRDLRGFDVFHMPAHILPRAY